MGAGDIKWTEGRPDGRAERQAAGLAIPTKEEMSVCAVQVNRFHEIAAQLNNCSNGVDGLVRRLAGPFPEPGKEPVGALGNVEAAPPTGLISVDEAFGRAKQELDLLETALQRLYELNLA